MLYCSSERFYRILFLCLLYWPREGLLYYYYPTIFWSPNNCRFNLNNQPGKNDIFEFNIKANSHLFFVCPNHAIWTDMGNKSPHYGRMYENLMLVDKAGFDKCSVDTTGNGKLNREIFRCDKNPQIFTYTEEIFSSQRAFSHKMRYESGEDYYFISTSDGTIESLNNTSGGHCQTRQMKFKVHVCGKNEDCKFSMPKCPYTDVFDAMDKPTAKPKSTVSTDFTTPENTTIKPFKKFDGAQPPRNSPRAPTNPGISKLVPAADDDDTPPVIAKQSSMSFWGSDRTHIIIHITMALLIIVLVLSLVYVLITRRRKTVKETNCNGNGINSELYLQRPLSMGPVEIDI